MKKLLLVDADPHTLSTLDVSLRKAGYSVTTAIDGVDAAAKIGPLAPDLLLTDTRLPKVDGFALVRRLKERPESAAVPVIFLPSQESVTDRERALELGVDDYIARPVYLCELTARIDLLVARSARRLIGSIEGPTTGLSRLTGSTEDFALVDLLQHFDRSRKSGVLSLFSGMQLAQVWFRDGRVVDAQLGALRGEEAICRALIWNDATYEIELKPVANEDVIVTSTPTLLARGMRRVDEWMRLCDQVQPLATLLDIRASQLVDRLSRMRESPGDLQAMLRLLLRSSSETATSATLVRAETGERGVRPAAEPAPFSPPRVASPPPPVAIAPPEPAAALSQPVAPAALSSPAASTSPESPVAAPPQARAASAPVLAVVTPRSAGPAAALPPAAPARATPSHRPSSAPWTREIGAGHGGRQPAEAEEEAAGVPRAMGTGAKRGAFATAALAGVLLVAGGIYALQARQQRDADEARGGADRGAVAAQTAAAPEPAVASNPVSSPEVVPPPAVVAAAPAPVAAQGPPAEPARPGGARNASAAPAVVPGLPPPATRLAALAPATARAAAGPAKDARETMIDVRSSLNSKSPLVRDAERALLKGDTDRAQALSQQAVSANPGDADAWLTLAASRRASGDLAAAHDAYRGCIEQAHTVDLEHCRILAESR
jgi:CheY-like chemotaxis protein